MRPVPASPTPGPHVVPGALAAVLVLALATLAPRPAAALSPLGHALVAQRLLDEVQARPAAYPRSLQAVARDPLLRSYFLGGAVAPDLLGRAGGLDLVRLAHRGVPGALVQALLRGARTPEERAWALGWVTHLGADRMVHPYMVARGLEPDTLAPAHVTFEVALDVLVASWARDLAPAALLTGHRHATALLGRALAEVTGAPVTVTVGAPVGFKVVGTAVHMDGAALARRKLHRAPRLGARVADPDGVLHAVTRMAARRGTSNPATLKVKPTKELRELYSQARQRAWDLVAAALRGDWGQLNRDVDTGGVPTAAHRPAGLAAVGYYYALRAPAADHGREAEIMKQLTRHGLGNAFLCRGLPGAAGGLLRLALPGGPGGPGPADFVPICLGPYGTREQALKVRVELTEAVRGAYRDATGKPATAVTLSTDAPRLAL